MGLVKWYSETISCLDLYQVNIDGKVLTATAKEAKKKSGLCLISARLSEQSVSLEQLKTAVKSNEKTAIPELYSPQKITTVNFPISFSEKPILACFHLLRNKNPLFDFAKHCLFTHQLELAYFQLY